VSGKDLLPVDVVQRCFATITDSGMMVNAYSDIGLKVFGFTPESSFTFIPESRSDSSRNRVHLAPESSFTLPRNTQ
jgi:hypothetical protein